MDFDQTGKQGKMSEKNMTKILKRFGMEDWKLRETPCEPKLEHSNDTDKMEDPRTYRVAVGNFIYLSSCVRPDIGFVVRIIKRTLKYREACFLMSQVYIRKTK